MTNQTIDGVPRELLERLLTDACNENWSDLNELLHSAGACRCKRYGKGSPHWPCPAHPAPAVHPLGEPVASIELVENKTYGGMHIAKWDNLGALKEGEHLLYAEQPAPVAVVLPERSLGDDGVCTESHYAKGRNDCLDEVAKINTHTVSVGLLRRIVGHPLVLPIGPDQIAAIQELSQIGKLNN